MKRVRKHKTIGFMLVVMMTILALLPLVSLAMEQNSSEEHVGLEEIQHKKIENQGSLGELQQEIKPLKMEGEIALYAGLVVTCPILLILGITLCRRRDVENINYW